MGRMSHLWFGLVVALSLIGSPLLAQFYGEPDLGHPGDRAVQAYLAAEAEQLDAKHVENTKSLADWTSQRDRWREEYFYMLGLSPMPEKTPLNATITGKYEGEGYVVDLLHFQSLPGLYVTGNLYRPKNVPQGERLPTILYVCGHSNRGRDGNKTAYQSHGIWFARHGYVCLILDSLQRSEVPGTHHGTAYYSRWWWHSRGYTSAGVECWNGIRGVDYLVSRPDVDASRIGVTGISGGGAASFWIAAADERIKVAAPVSGMADLTSYVGNHVLSGHCDCMLMHNTFRWPWSRIAALIAPRPLLFVNSDADPIFPMDANDRLINQFENYYRLYGASDRVDAVVSVGGHAYREDLRKACYRFMNLHLKGDPSDVTDSEVDLVDEGTTTKPHPIETKLLRVFPTDADLPKDERNSTIDRDFVQIAKPEPPTQGAYDSWRSSIESELRRVSFRAFPRQPETAAFLHSESEDVNLLATERNVRVRLKQTQKTIGAPKRVILVVRDSESDPTKSEWFKNATKGDDALFVLEPRGRGISQWTSHLKTLYYVERSFALLGKTADSCRVYDIQSVAAYLNRRFDGAELIVAGEGSGAVLAAYAAALFPEIDGAILAKPTPTHMDESAPAILNALRVCDIPDVIGMIAPRPLELYETSDSAQTKVRAIYEAANATLITK